MATGDSHADFMTNSLVSRQEHEEGKAHLTGMAADSNFDLVPEKLELVKDNPILSDGNVSAGNSGKCSVVSGQEHEAAGTELFQNYVLNDPLTGTEFSQEKQQSDAWTNVVAGEVLLNFLQGGGGGQGKLAATPKNSKVKPTSDNREFAGRNSSTPAEISFVAVEKTLEPVDNLPIKFTPDVRPHVQPYQCEICKESFPDKDHARAHVLCAHGDTSAPMAQLCPVCQHRCVPNLRHHLAETPLCRRKMSQCLLCNGYYRAGLPYSRHPCVLALEGKWQRMMTIIQGEFTERVRQSNIQKVPNFMAVRNASSNGPKKHSNRNSPVQCNRLKLGITTNAASGTSNNPGVSPNHLQKSLHSSINHNPGQENNLHSATRLTTSAQQPPSSILPSANQIPTTGSSSCASDFNTSRAFAADLPGRQDSRQQNRATTDSNCGQDLVGRANQKASLPINQRSTSTPSGPPTVVMCSHCKTYIPRCKEALRLHKQRCVSRRQETTTGRSAAVVHSRPGVTADLEKVGQPAEASKPFRANGIEPNRRPSQPTGLAHQESVPTKRTKTEVKENAPRAPQRTNSGAANKGADKLFADFRCQTCKTDFEDVKWLKHHVKHVHGESVNFSVRGNTHGSTQTQLICDQPEVDAVTMPGSESRPR